MAPVGLWSLVVPREGGAKAELIGRQAWNSGDTRNYMLDGTSGGTGYFVLDRTSKGTGDFVLDGTCGGTGDFMLDETSGDGRNRKITSSNYS